MMQLTEVFAETFLAFVDGRKLLPDGRKAWSAIGQVKAAKALLGNRSDQGTINHWYTKLRSKKEWPVRIHTSTYETLKSNIKSLCEKAPASPWSDFPVDKYFSHSEQSEELGTTRKHKDANLLTHAEAAEVLRQCLRQATPNSVDIFTFGEDGAFLRGALKVELDYMREPLPWSAVRSIHMVTINPSTAVELANLGAIDKGTVKRLEMSLEFVKNLRVATAQTRSKGKKRTPVSHNEREVPVAHYVWKCLPQAFGTCMKGVVLVAEKTISPEGAYMSGPDVREFRPKVDAEQYALHLLRLQEALKNSIPTSVYAGSEEFRQRVMRTPPDTTGLK